MNCELCNTTHDGTYGSGRFCGVKCSRGFSTLNLSPERKIEKRRKVSTKLTKYSEADKSRICSFCKNVFQIKSASQKCCSRSCGVKFGYLNSSAETKAAHAKRSSDRMQKRHNEGDTSIGWQSRKMRSFPEQYFEQLLRDRNIKFETEVRIGKWFADFVIGSRVLEIDGRQHNDRRDKDAEKDLYLQSLGFSVTRISWENPKTELGRTRLLSALDKFLMPAYISGR